MDLNNVMIGLPDVSNLFIYVELCNLLIIDIPTIIKFWKIEYHNIF